MVRFQRLPPTEVWSQLELLCQDPVQRTYELIRPIILFGQPIAERAEQTGVAERTLFRAVERFDHQGMPGLLPAARVGQRGRIPPVLRRVILELKAEYAGLSPHEIARICYARFDRRPSHHTVEQILAEHPVPEVLGRRFFPYRQIATPRLRRLAVIQLHVEGWSVSSIAGYLQCSRPTVYQTLERWKETFFADLDDRPHTRHRRSLKVTLQALDLARRWQENPELGEFRLHAKLKAEFGIDLSPRTCGRILALNRTLYGLGKPAKEQFQLPPKAMPFKATRRHQFWTVDIRYLDHRLGEGKVYSITILENYSRTILASGLFRTQDTASYLVVLRAAILAYGSPETLVSDSGGVFLANAAQAIYEALGIQKQEIDRGEPWESYIETNFNVQRRMADYQFERAARWEELVAAHDRWRSDFNEQEHWAHRKRKDGRRSPAEVLGWVQGTLHPKEVLDEVFGPIRFGRRLDRAGYARFRRWRIYGERGLARKPAAIWLSNEYLTVEFADDPLAQYVVRFGATVHELRRVSLLRLFETRFRSPQPFLWELGAGEWLTVIRLPARRYRRRRPAAGTQGHLLAGEAGAAVG
jgi:putative transposase